MISVFAAVFRSFGYAFRGVVRTLKHERNFRIHAVAVILVTWFAFLYEVTVGQAVVLVILYAMVLSLELVNTSVERAVDLASPEKSPLAEFAKDAAAGAVLVAALASVTVAVLMFRDASRWRDVGEKMSSPVRIVCLVLFLVLALLFVRGRNPEKNDKS